MMIPDRLAEIREDIKHFNDPEYFTALPKLWITKLGDDATELLAELDATRAENSVLQGTNAGLSDLAVKYQDTIASLSAQVDALVTAVNMFVDNHVGLTVTALDRNNTATCRQGDVWRLASAVGRFEEEKHSFTHIITGTILPRSAAVAEAKGEK